MTTTAPVAAPALACPDCRAPLTGAPACPSCDLPLLGPDAARLWQVDVELARLDGVRTHLLAERRSLLAVLRGAAPSASAAPARDRSEWTPRRVQNALLVLGGVLLAVAAAVFAAVTYDRLGVGGRAAVLLALTALAAAAAPRLARRGLGATAETLAAVALALAALDAWGLRRLGVGAELADLAWLAAASGTVAVLSGGYAAAVRLQLPRLAAPVLAHVSALAAIAALEPSAASASLLLTAVAAVDLVVLAALPLGRDVRTAVAALAGGAGSLSVALGLTAAPEPSEGALALGACAALAAAAAVVASGAARTLLAALPAGLAALAVVALLHQEVSDAALPLAAAVVGLVAAVAAAVLPRAERLGPLAGAGAVAAAAVAPVAGDVVRALAGPLLWLADPWTLPAGTGARAAVAPLTTWSGTAHVVGVLLVAAAVAGVIALRLDRRALPAAGALAALAALVLPVALDVPHAAALLLLLVLAAAALAGADALRTRGPGADAALVAGLAAAALAAAWSTADRGTTLAVLPAVAVLLAIAAARPAPDVVRQVAAGLAAAVAGAELAALGAARDLAPEQVGGLLLLAPAAALLASRLLPAVRAGLEVAAAFLTAVAVLLATGDPGWLSWTLAGAGLLALAHALVPDRRVLAPVGALLLTASSWVRLSEAGIDQPEPYVLPLAALALVLGHLRFRRDDAVRSHAAYGPGLGLLLLPSLVAALADDGLARPLLLGATALGVVLVGARQRLQAPLLFGGVTLLGVALHLLAPYTSAVPRWTALAAAGTLLVVVGATFEQRRRELAALHERYEALR